MLNGKTSVERLTELGFDPIESLVKEIQKIDEIIEKEMALGEKRRTGMIAMLSANRIKIAETLMAYSYSKVPQTIETGLTKEPIRIILE